MNTDTLENRSPDMKKVRSIQMELLQKVLEVCKKYDLNIWVDGGTLLGTVREHGYIPWDDDIDLFMLREDYDKLLSVASVEFKKPFFFQNAYTDVLYPRGHSQVRYDGTAAIMKSEVHCRYHQGIFIDIFVYDALPLDEKCLNNRLRSISMYYKLLYTYIYGGNARGLAEGVKRIVSKIYFSIFSFVGTFAKYDELCRHMPGKVSDVVSCPAFSTSVARRIRRDKSWLTDTVYMPFENISVPVPIGYDGILRNQYGNDYMTPRKDPSLHGLVFFDTERSYVDVLRDINSGVLRIDEGL